MDGRLMNHNFLDRAGVVHSVLRKERPEAYGILDCRLHFTVYDMWVPPMVCGHAVSWMVTCLACIAASRR